MMDGYVRIPRVLLEGSAWRGLSIEQKGFFVELCNLVAFSEHGVNTRYGDMKLKRGQYVTTQRELCGFFGITRGKVRSILDKLAKIGFVSVKNCTTTETATETAKGSANRFTSFTLLTINHLQDMEIDVVPSDTTGNTATETANKTEERTEERTELPPYNPPRGGRRGFFPRDYLLEEERVAVRLKSDEGVMRNLAVMNPRNENSIWGNPKNRMSVHKMGFPTVVDAEGVIGRDGVLNWIRACLFHLNRNCGVRRRFGLGDIENLTDYIYSNCSGMKMSQLLLFFFLLRFPDERVRHLNWYNQLTINRFVNAMNDFKRYCEGL